MTTDNFANPDIARDPSPTAAGQGHPEIGEILAHNVEILSTHIRPAIEDDAMIAKYREGIRIFLRPIVLI